MNNSSNINDTVSERSYWFLTHIIPWIAVVCLIISLSILSYHHSPYGKCNKEENAPCPCLAKCLNKKRKVNLSDSSHINNTDDINVRSNELNYEIIQ